MDNIHKPALDQIGYEDLLARNAMGEFNTLFEPDKNPLAMGKIPSWSWYRTNVNKTYGKFAVGNELSFMCLNRIFKDKKLDATGGISGSTYIDPRDYYGVFASRRLNNQPFWVQIGFRIKKRIAMSARVLPNV